jgi:hypothetical protein
MVTLELTCWQIIIKAIILFALGIKMRKRLGAIWNERFESNYQPRPEAAREPCPGSSPVPDCAVRGVWRSLTVHHHQTARLYAAATSEKGRQMAMSDLIPHLFRTGGGASAVDLARANRFVVARPWLIPLVLGLGNLALAVFAKPYTFGTHTNTRTVWAALGVLCLIIALLFALK